jgi:hypothetical protein
VAIEEREKLVWGCHFDLSVFHSHSIFSQFCSLCVSLKSLTIARTHSHNHSHRSLTHALSVIHSHTQCWALIPIVGFRILEFAEKNILFDCSKLGYFIAFTKWKENNRPTLYKPITWQLE